MGIRSTKKALTLCTVSENDGDRFQTEKCTICINDGTKMDLVVGEIYFDFSGQEQKVWFRWDKYVPGQALARTSNVYGQPLLYLGMTDYKNPSPYIGSYDSQRTIKKFY